MSKSPLHKPWYKKPWGAFIVFISFPISVPILVWTKTDWHKSVKWGITILCALFIIGSILTTQQEREQALVALHQAETYITEHNISGALQEINKSKELYSDKDNNPAYELEKYIGLLQSESFLKETLTNMSDDEYSKLVNGELTNTYIPHKELNQLFLELLIEKKDMRSLYIEEITEKKRKEQENALLEEERKIIEERKNKIQSQFSAWDGSHRNLTEFIKESMNDPKSYEHVETLYIDNGDFLTITTTFRGKNAFGGVVKNNITAKVSLEGVILEIIE